MPQCNDHLGIRDGYGDCCGGRTILCGGGAVKATRNRNPSGPLACGNHAIYGKLGGVGCIRYIGCTRRRRRESNPYKTPAMRLPYQSATPPYLVLPLAEGAGFEPAWALAPPDSQSGAFVRSATPPPTAACIYGNSSHVPVNNRGAADGTKEEAGPTRRWPQAPGPAAQSAAEDSGQFRGNCPRRPPARKAKGEGQRIGCFASNNAKTGRGCFPAPSIWVAAD